MGIGHCLRLPCSSNAGRFSGHSRQCFIRYRTECDATWKRHLECCEFKSLKATLVWKLDLCLVTSSITFSSMIFLLLAFHYLCGIASSAQTTYTSTTTVEAEEWTHIYVYTTNFRSTAEIVTSCISTILLCTWFTIHPDVCGYRSTWMQRTGRKLELFLWALLAPELIVMWACNQWVGARRIRDEMGPGAIQYPWVQTRAECEWLHLQGVTGLRSKHISCKCVEYSSSTMGNQKSYV